MEKTKISSVFFFLEEKRNCDLVLRFKKKRKKNEMRMNFQFTMNDDARLARSKEIL